MADIRRRAFTTKNNATSISRVPVTSDAAADNQALLYNATTGYWEWKEVIDAAADQTFTGLVTFDGTMRIGSTGTPITRLNTYDIAHFDNIFATNRTALQAHTPAFPSIPTLLATMADPSDNINAIDKSTSAHTPNTVDEFEIVVRNLRNSTQSSTVHPYAFAIA